MHKKSPRLCLTVLGFCIATRVWAGGHTWYVNEIFSNASGTIQFVEVKEFLGGNGETGTAGHNVTSNTKTFTIPNNVAAPTGFKHILIATPAFVGLPGAPTPDYVLPPGSVPFFSAAGDTIRYVPNCTFILGAGILPTNGVHSLTINTHHGHAFTIGNNSPTNYAGQSGSINLACTDLDGDGYGNPGDPLCPNGAALDCDDDDNAIHPGALEFCEDGVDNDCDLLTDCQDTNCDNSAGACVPAMTGAGFLLVLAGVAAGGGLAFRKRRSKQA